MGLSDRENKIITNPSRFCDRRSQLIDEYDLNLKFQIAEFMSTGGTVIQALA